MRNCYRKVQVNCLLLASLLFFFFTFEFTELRAVHAAIAL